jgi:hypothetical protein
VKKATPQSQFVRNSLDGEYGAAAKRIEFAQFTAVVTASDSSLPQHSLAHHSKVRACPASNKYLCRRKFARWRSTFLPQDQDQLQIRPGRLLTVAAILNRPLRLLLRHTATAVSVYACVSS